MGKLTQSNFSDLLIHHLLANFTMNRQFSIEPLALTVLIASISSAHAIDLNSNGINDVFEAQFPEISSVSPTVDTDGDGQDNASEARALTDPLDPTDCFKLEPLDETADSYLISWPSKEGLRYQVQHSSDSQIWVFMGDILTGTGAGLTSEVFKSSLPETEGNFFRVNVVSAIDSDGDSIPDWAEELLGFSSTSANSVRSAANGGDLQQLTNFLTGANPNGGISNTESAGIPSDENASRFLAQSTFGPRLDDIASVQALGPNSYEKWIDQQMALPASYMSPYIEHVLSIHGANVAAVEAGDIQINDLFYEYNPNADRIDSRNVLTPWMRNAINAPDQLRQRMGWGLSQIFVTGHVESDGGLFDNTRPLVSYYDLLLEHSFGNFEELLTSIARHPMMGRYLSHLNNRKGSEDGTRTPDENFAREIMQLFSIGLQDLNLDGSVRTDENGQPLETYTQEDISVLARIFTGMHLSGASFGSSSLFGANAALPMIWDLSEKDTAAKTFLCVRDLNIEISDNTYSIGWDGVDGLTYAIQVRDNENVWRNVNITTATTTGALQVELSFAELGGNLSFDQFRVKHHIEFEDPIFAVNPQSTFLPVSISEQTDSYTLTWDAISGTRYWIYHFDSTQSSLQALRLTAAVPTSGNFTFVQPKQNLEDGLTTSELFIIPLGVAPPPLLQTSGMEYDPELELNEFIKVLVHHPNTAPFMANRLIKHFVTSQPSPSYIKRVASVFRNNGSGGAGDFGATLKAILLDPEARGAQYLTNPQFGKLKEPVLRLTMLARAFEAGRDDSYDPNPSNSADHNTGIQWVQHSFVNTLQLPLHAPSVFNYYQPDYSHPILLQQAGLDSPEFQIHNAITATILPNTLFSLCSELQFHGRLNTSEVEPFSITYSDDFRNMAQTNEFQLDTLNLLLAHGSISALTRSEIQSALTIIDTFTISPASAENSLRTQWAVYFSTITADTVILK